MEAFEKDNLISDNQFGGRDGRSCVAFIFYRENESLQERDDGTDIKRRFETASSIRLLWKSEHPGGMKGKFFKWKKDFPHVRQMGAVIRGNHSEWRQ